MNAETSAAETETRAPRGGAKAVGGITALNVAVAATAIVTGPLLARALGPTGRGDLAAVLTTIGLLPVIANPGLVNYTARAIAQGVSARRLIGSVGAIALAIGVLLVVLSPGIAALVAGDRERVRLLLLIGLATMPVVLAASVPAAIVWGRSDWRTWSFIRAIPPFGGLIVVVALAATDTLTVTTAAISAIVLSVLSFVPLLGLLRRSGRPRWDRAVARASLHFGTRVWLWSIAAEANLRLDQLLMTRLVAARELGFYVVAVNVAMVQNAFIAAVLSVIYPRVSAGDQTLTARALRTTVTLVACGAVALELIVGFAIPWLFGSDFEPAVEMARILIIAAIPQAATQVLSSALVASGVPGIPARGQLISLALTIPGLVLLLGPLGGVGAALVSLLAYVVTAGYLLWQARRRLALDWGELLLMRRSDLAPIARALRGRLRRSR